MLVIALWKAGSADGGGSCAQGGVVFVYRYLSSIKGQREAAEKFYTDLGMSGPKTMDVDKQQLIIDVRNALYASKICSYAQVILLPPH